LLSDQTIQTLCNVADVIIKAYNNNNYILWFGNGGSAADARHIACELVNRFLNVINALKKSKEIGTINI
jgi:D-sedoheptulose 7-phosphate isomerase